MGFMSDGGVVMIYGSTFAECGGKKSTMIHRGEH